MNLAQFRVRVSAVVGIDSSAEVSLIDGWVNDGVLDFVARTKCHKRLISMSLTADEPEYTLDTDILAFEKLWIDSASGSGQDRPLEPIDSAEIFAMQAYESPSDVGVMYYSLDGAHLLMLHPAPASSADVLKGIYVPRPSAMSVTSDSPASSAYGGVPAEFHPVIEAYAKWKAAEYDQHSPSQAGLQFQAEYEKGVADATKAMNLKGGVRLAPAKVGRRRGWRTPTTPGTDWGG